MKITANGISMNYTLDGPASAPVVTLSHSLATDLSMWDPQMKALTARYRVLRYDTRGHGGTEAPAAAYTLDQLADDARALLQALGIAKTHWIGLSMGGMIGQALALKSPELFLSLSLCDTSSRIPAEAKPLWQERIKTAQTQGMEPLVEGTIARWFTAPFREQRKDVVRSRPHHDPADAPAGLRRMLRCDLGTRPDRSPAGHQASDADRRRRRGSGHAGRRVTGHPGQDRRVAAGDPQVGGAPGEHGAARGLHEGVDDVPDSSRLR